MTNKPFDPDKPVQTRDGRAARIICTDRKTNGSQMPVLALVTNYNSNSEYVEFFTRKGMTHRDGSISKLDLINVPVVRKACINLNPKGKNGLVLGGFYNNKDEADEMASGNRWSCIEIEVEEGEGLDRTETET